MSDESPSLEGPLPPAALDDPHLQPYAKHPEAAQAVAAVAMVVGFLGFIGFGVAYWVGANTQWEALTLGVGLLALGFGVTAWGKYLMPQGPFVEERHDFHSTDAERDAMTAAITERGGMVVKRRKLLGGLFAAGVDGHGHRPALPAAALARPKPEETRRPTLAVHDQLEEGLASWSPSTAGSHRRRPRGRRGAHRLPPGLRGVLTRPGHPHPAGQLGLQPPYPLAARPHRLGRGQGYVAYSKMCTHLGCPVGLYQEQTQQLVCPCHQSIFNVNAGAVPEFGPPPARCPSCPSPSTQPGSLRAKGGFNQAVGPGFWERP